jgi:NAD(P)H-hydrate epimerase
MITEVTLERAAELLPARKADTHKGDYGKVLIVAGSLGLAGASVLTARSAVRGGAGLVYVAVPEEIYPITAPGSVESIVFPRSEARVFELLETCDVCAVGPGLGQSEQLDTLVTEIVKRSRIPLVIDADGINALSRHIDILDNAECQIVLTPHGGEFSRLRAAEGKSAELSESREVMAREFAVKHTCALVLKGNRTVTAFSDGTAFVNTSGNPGMAKGGSGDALTGLIAALAGQFPLRDAVPLAVYIHGLAGDICRDKLSEYSVAASDIINAFPQAFVTLEKLRK